MKRFCAIFSIVLMGLQLLLILASWIVSAVFPSSPIHALIGSGGLRWFIGSFANNLASPLFVYVILCSITYSSLVKSDLISCVASAMAKRQSFSMQQKFAFRIMLIEFVLFVAGVIFISAMPHAILLSVTGALFPSSFSSGLVPMICFELFVLSMIYGIVGGEVNTLEKFWNCIVSGANFLPAVCFLYILIVQLFYSTCYVLGI